MILVPHFTRSLLLRSLLLWAFLRVLTTAVGAALAPPGANPLRQGPLAVLLTFAVVGVAGWVSARRRNEDLFLVSLGYGRARLLATFVLPAALAELAVQVAARR
ncbi:MAG TPA: hypothetical protein VF541_10425 [Longimicrobium sp.]